MAEGVSEPTVIACAVMAGPLLSVVSPLHDEAPNVERLAGELRAALDRAGIEYEIVLVDDGSADGTGEIIAGLAREGSAIRGVRLARSFGQQAAILAGLAASTGDLVVVMDADMQDPPSLVPELVRVQRETGAPLVLARRNSQPAAGWLKRTGSAAFTALLGRIAEHPIHRNVGDFYLMRRDVADALIRTTAHGGPVFLRGDLGWIGADAVAVTFDRAGRPAGRTKYTLARMRRFAWDGITSATLSPLRIPYLLAWLMIAGCATFAAIGAAGVLGPALSIVCAVVLGAAAAILASIGILGEYLGRTHRMVRGRPPYWVAATHNVPPEALLRLAGRPLRN